MPRHKSKRSITFHPPCTHFAPLQPCSDASAVTLLAEEVEALYLMDMLELYQEEAATKMEVSRPTFARIIKSASTKVALALLNRRELHLDSEKESYCVALCSDAKTPPYHSLHPKAAFIHLFTLSNKRITEHKSFANPLLENRGKPSFVLSQLFNEHHVNLFVTGSIGEGFKSTLATKGIQLLLQDAISEKELLTLW